jgi:hypothetical protein
MKASTRTDGNGLRLCTWNSFPFMAIPPSSVQRPDRLPKIVGNLRSCPRSTPQKHSCCRPEMHPSDSEGPRSAANADLAAPAKCSGPCRDPPRRSGPRSGRSQARRPERERDSLAAFDPPRRGERSRKGQEDARHTDSPPPATGAGVLEEEPSAFPLFSVCVILHGSWTGDEGNSGVKLILRSRLHYVQAR